MEGSDEERTQRLEMFMAVTGANKERAKFFLECANWSCDLAIANFYEEPNDDIVLNSDSDNDMGFSIDPPAQVRPSSPQRVASIPSSVPPTKPPAKPSSTNSRIAMLDDLKREESSDEEEGQAFYAGGSNSGGGQQILGPKKKNANSLVADMFKNAKEHGAEVLDPSQSNTGQKKPSPFQGTAYRLGAENDPGGALASTSSGAESLGRPKTVNVVLRLWKNGFSVDNGPLRDFHDPANMEFLTDIKNGKVPRELSQMAKGSIVDLDMEDHSNEDYVKPKVTLQAFSGHGFRLGNPTDNVSVLPMSMPGSSQSGSSVDGRREETSVPVLNVDESQPVTSLQIRLPDGSRLVSKFNHSHTVADVKRFIINSRPNYSQSSFVLMTTFPNKEITDESSSLAAANLLNTVLVLKMK